MSSCIKNNRLLSNENNTVVSLLWLSAVEERRQIHKSNLFLLVNMLLF